MTALYLSLAGFAFVGIVAGIARFGTVLCPHCGRRVLCCFVVCTVCGSALEVVRPKKETGTVGKRPPPFQTDLSTEPVPISGTPCREREI